MTSMSHFQYAYFNRASKFGQNIEKMFFITIKSREKNFGQILQFLFYGKNIRFWNFRFLSENKPFLYS